MTVATPAAAHQKEEAVKERRISEEKARYEEGIPVGGHERGRRR